MKDWQKVREEFDFGDIHVSLGALCEAVVQLRVENERLKEEQVTVGDIQARPAPVPR
jgi:hypothetical protein